MDKLSIIRQPIATELDILNQVLSESLNTTSPLMNQVTGNYLKTKGKQFVLFWFYYVLNYSGT